MAETLEKGATFSRCGTYRYSLWRRWDAKKPVLLWLCLNPSTADAVEDDPTLRRCMGFARDWGYGTSITGNLFAYRATDPEAMKRAQDPVGPNNNQALKRLAAKADLVIAAWGNDGNLLGRADWARRTIPHLHYLKMNSSGEPAHPLYLPKQLRPKQIQVS